MKHRSPMILAGAAATLLPLAASAHPGHEVHASLVMGLMHPLTGWDHLLLLLCLGALVAGRGAAFIAGVGVLLPVALAGGATLGLALPQAPFVEPAILATAGVSLALLVSRARLTRGGLLALSLGFALVHGVAHGQEAPSGNLGAYFAGFTFAGTALYVIGTLVAGAVTIALRRPLVATG